MREIRETCLVQFENLLEDRFGLEFPGPRLRVLDSALARCMRARRIDDPAEYYSCASESSAELSVLVDLVTNDLSRFFRNRAQIRALQTSIFPRLVAPFTVWVAGCATGEEPYSLVIELLEALPPGSRFRVVATDISVTALKSARSGIYRRGRAKEIPAHLLDRYFLLSGEELSLSQAVRHHVQFLAHSVTDAPPVAGASLVLCRNVLTYLSPGAASTAARHLRDALRCGGHLVIGHSEELPRTRSLKRDTDIDGRFYVKTCP